MDTDVSPAPTPGSETEPVHLVIMGVAGSGKTTVATLLAERTHRPYAEADEFHPQANIDKMSAGTRSPTRTAGPGSGRCATGSTSRPPRATPPS